MSACAIKQWGRGTPCVKESNTAAAKEMTDKLAKMKAEREKQDTMWGQTDTPSSGEWYIQPYTPDGTLRK
jgi:hypothetical protein